MPCSSTRCLGRPPYVLFPLAVGLPLMGSRSCCANSPSALRETPPHVMLVEQGLPWHPVATGLAHPLCCRCLPCARSPIPSILVPCSRCSGCLPCLAVPLLLLVASPALLCPFSLYAVLALVPPGVAPAFCVSMLLLPLPVGAPGCPFCAPTPIPPAYPPPLQGFHISVRRGLSRARLAGHGPFATPVAGTSRRAGHSPRPCGVRGHLVEGGGGGSLGMRRIWWLLQCLHLIVPLCIVVCPVGARLTAMHGAPSCPFALLLVFLPISGSFFFSWHAHRCWCAALGGQHVTPYLPLWLSGCPTFSWVVPGAPGTFAHVSKFAN